LSGDQQSRKPFESLAARAERVRKVRPAACAF
jgi:hypothetical protein